MALIKTSIISLCVTSVKMLSGLIVSKAVAIYIGPTGLALIGQFQNFTQIINTLGQGAIGVGIIKYTAQYKESSHDLAKLLSTAIKISFLTTILVSILVAVLSKQASLIFLGSVNYQYIFLILSLTLVFSVINNLALMIVNGLKEIRLWAYVSVAQSLLILFLTTLLIYVFGINGALLSMVITQSLVFFILILKLRRHPVFSLRNFTKPFDVAIAKKLFGYSLMAITGAVVLPVSHLIVRKYLGNSLGWEMAGYWQAITYVSAIYLTMASTTLRIYYLPKLSETEDVRLLRREILGGFKVIVPFVICASIAIFLLRDFVIAILFTENFLAVRDLFLWQLLGDVVKVSAMLFAHLMLAKEMLKIYIVSEIVFGITFVAFSVLFTEQYGLVGMTYAYFFNYSLYLIFTCVFTKRYWL